MRPFKCVLVGLSALAVATTHAQVPASPQPPQRTIAESLILKYSRATSERSLAEQKQAAAEFESALRKVNKADPFCLKAWYDLGTDFWRLAEYPQAARAFDVAIRHRGIVVDPRFKSTPKWAASQRAMVLADMHAPLAQRLAAWHRFEAIPEVNPREIPMDYAQSKTAIITQLLESKSKSANVQVLQEVEAWIRFGRSGKLDYMPDPHAVGPVVTLDWRENARVYLRNLINTAADLRDLANAKAAYKLDHHEFGMGDEEIVLRSDLLRADKGKLNAVDFQALLAEFPKPVLSRAGVLSDAMDEAFTRDDCNSVIKYANELLAMPAVPDSEENPAQHHPFARQALDGCNNRKGHTTKVIPKPTRASTMDIGVSGLLVVGCGYGLVKMLSQLRPRPKRA